MRLTGHSKIEFHKLRASSHPDEHNLYELVRVDTGESLKIDKNVIELVKQLSKGLTVSEAAHEIKFSVHVVLMLLKILRGANFFKSIDGTAVDDAKKNIHRKVKISPQSRIQFYRLRSSATPDEHSLYGLVRWDTDDTLKVDKNVIELVKHLTNGKTVQESANAINFSIDTVLILLKILQDAHFFKSIDGVVLEDSGTKIKPWLMTVDRKWFRWIIYKPFLYIILSIGISGIVAGLFLNGIPSYKAFFWTNDLFIVFISLFIADIFLTFVHELAHFSVTKAVGGEAEMRISYRYIYIVAETESYHLGVVPKSHRYLVYLAGSIVDLFIVGLLYWFLALTNLFGINLGSMYNFLTALILVQFLGVIWQMNAFLETDMYSFLSEYLGIENLRNDAIKYIAHHTMRWKKVLLSPVKRVLLLFSSDYSESSDDLRLLNKTEKKKLFLYVLVLISGMIFTTLEFIFYNIPRDYTFVSESVTNLINAAKNADILGVSKSIIIICIALFEYALLIVLKNKEIARRRHKYRENNP